MLDVIEDGKVYMWVCGLFDVFVWFGGLGGMIVLLIVILIFFKWVDYLIVVKLFIGFGIFNINELVMFGLLIVLNVIMFILFLIVLVVVIVIGWLVIYFGFVVLVL